MPYLEPRKTNKGWVLPKKEGGVHQSSKGKVIYYKSKEDAEAAGRAIMASEGKKSSTRSGLAPRQ